jgi:hypothetical protein
MDAACCLGMRDEKYSEAFNTPPEVSPGSIVKGRRQLWSAMGSPYFVSAVGFSAMMPVRVRNPVSILPATKSGCARIRWCSGIEV